MFPPDSAERKEELSFRRKDYLEVIEIHDDKWLCRNSEGWQGCMLLLYLCSFTPLTLHTDVHRDELRDGGIITATVRHSCA
jgi:hypothetical protein